MPINSSSKEPDSHGSLITPVAALAIAELVKIHAKKGYLTYSDINEALPDQVDSPEEIEAVIVALQRNNFAIVDPREEEHFLFSRKKVEAEKAARIICPDVTAELFQEFRSHPEKMYQLPSRKFEELVASIFSNHGYAVELTPATRDGGFDILAVRSDKLSGDHVHLVECKRYAQHHKVGVGVVRTLLGVVSDRDAHKGHLVTTSCFTADADLFGKQNSTRLVLSDYRKLVRWLHSLDLK